MKKNESFLDRFARIIIALLVMFTAYVMLIGFWQSAAYVFAAIMAITAALGFSPLYAFFGINSNILKQ